MTRFKNHLSGPSEPSSKASEPSSKAIAALPRATLVGLMSLLLLGCVVPPVPVPTFIGLTFTDEVSITPNSLATGMVFAEKCRAQGHAVDDAMFQTAAKSLTGSLRQDFEQQRNRQMQSEAAPKDRDCRNLVKDLNRMKDKKLVISG